MTALSIIQNACTRLGFSSPSAVFSSTDQQLVQLRNLMNQEGQYQQTGGENAYPWTVLITEKTFSTTAAAIQASAIPTDFGWYINETMWNRTTVIPGVGPLGADEWQAIQAQSILALPDFYFRFRGGSLLMSPTPTAAQTVAYEYVSTYWAQTSGAAGLTEMTADTDTAKVPENLITLGVIWRFLAAKGLDYAEPFRTYGIEVQKAQARDGGKKKANLSGRTRRPWNGNIKEGGFTL